MGRLLDEDDVTNALRVAYWDEHIQSAKDDPCIVDAMTDWAIRQVKALPSAESERKKGKWIIDPLHSTTNDIHQVYRHLQCSECGHQEPWPWPTRRNFCPNCGADMR